ncbi:MAG TPA: pyruvate kinase [Treponemataceae bacterium]|mgnify:CR=1 FL=1|nr:pyruvate kinase [Treponemataceae bacterium]
MLSRKTKIVCSMGPTTESLDVLCELLRAGMNVARFNFSHSTHEYHRANMERVREASRITGIPCALLLDTKGPEIRTGPVAGDGKVEVRAGDEFTFTVDGSPSVAASDGVPGRISLSWTRLPQEIKKDCRILVADGLLEFLVVGTDHKETISCRALNSGAIGSKKNVNVIGIHPDLPILGDQDRADIEFGVSMGVDYIAASFVSSPADVVSILRFIEPMGSGVRVIAKIENEEGLDNIEDIIAVSAGVMVARGDLGVQLATERIPLAQKRIIQACNRAGKPVITATQMLDSMISNPRPTRAELTDVANAIFDGSDAVMLSGETANGAYPVEAVKTMAKIATTVEASEEYRGKMRQFHRFDIERGGVAEIVAHAAYQTATEIEAAAILTPTLSGNTARLLSTFRPEQPIIAATPSEMVRRQLLLNWGVVPLLVKVAEDSEEMTQNAMRAALDTGALKLADKVVMVAGVPIVSPMMVNTVRVVFVGNVLARGLNGGGCSNRVGVGEGSYCVAGGGDGFRATGRVVRAETLEDAFVALRKKGGEILVTRNLDMSFVPIIRVVSGLVIENPTELSEEILSMINPSLVWVSQVPGAMRILEPGLTITVDGREKIVYEGTI